jgi:hypothetical protein
MKWEYLVTLPEAHDDRQLKDELNKAGDDGWEFAGTVSRAAGSGGALQPRAYLVFKRPKR